jgi:hypothetical protein
MCGQQKLLQPLNIAVLHVGHMQVAEKCTTRQYVDWVTRRDGTCVNMKVAILTQAHDWHNCLVATCPILRVEALDLRGSTTVAATVALESVGRSVCSFMSVVARAT